TAGPRLPALGETFGLQPLLGKTVAIVPDARLSNRNDVATITERLLAISGEDGVDVNRKNLPQIAGAKLSTRFVILTNELPRLDDASGAIVGRMIVLQQTQSWFGKEDPQLTKKL